MKIRRRFDSLLGQVSMYRLVTLALIVLIIQAFVLSAIGIIFYSPTALATSLATLLIASYVSNWACAAVMRVHPHSESAIITALLLFFVAFPASAPIDLLVLAFAAFAANASKYLITYRGKHVLNPAAFGIALVTVVPLTSAAWWIATPAFLPLVALASFVILYRTRALGTGLLFVAFAFALHTVQMVSTGFFGIGDALWWSIGSYPLVFAAGFMVSEPLTLPSNRWHRVVVAVVMAVFAAFPFAVGSVLLGPEFAILFGNVVAFVLRRQRGLNLRLVRQTQLTPTSYEFEFEARNAVDFVPGQYVELTLPHRRADLRGLRRMFSITSVPGSQRLSIGVKVPADHHSTFKSALLELEEGDRVQATGISGGMALPDNSTIPVLLVAGGIGITPFVSQIRTAAQLAGAHERDIVLLYSVSDPSEIAYTELPGVRVYVLSPTAPEDMPEGWSYIGDRRIDAEVIASVVPDSAQRHTMVSGSTGFVDTVSVSLRGAGVRHITTDPFFGS